MPERRTVLLVPGLFSPRWHMSGLLGRLQRSGFRARVWDDASVFRNLDSSIERLHRDISAHEPGIGVVTHSFGDWLFRQAVAGSACSVTSLVSLVPVMRASTVAKLLAPLGRIAPEIAVMAREDRSARALGTPPEIRRLVVWARFDPWVRRTALDAFENTRSVVVTGSHNSILWQPQVQRLAAAHLLE